MCFALNLDLGFLGESLVVLWRMSETSTLNGNPSVSAGGYLRRTERRRIGVLWKISETNPGRLGVMTFNTSEILVFKDI